MILSGRGRAFTAGADLASFGDAEANAGLSPRDAADAGRRMAEAIEAMRAVTVAAIHGYCIGGGVVLAAACDLRVAADDTVFSIPEVDLGIPLAWGGIPRLVREIGPAMTRELVMTCRRFTAKEAKRLGFLNRVVPADDVMATAEGLASDLVAKSRLTLTATKDAVNAVLATQSGPRPRLVGRRRPGRRAPRSRVPRGRRGVPGEGPGTLSDLAPQHFPRKVPYRPTGSQTYVHQWVARCRTEGEPMTVSHQPIAQTPTLRAMANAEGPRNARNGSLRSRAALGKASLRRRW